ncbi:RICIN domain-containing protein [Phytohabitans sp. ZYX-F-186]|uniref:RICIN domain-containing protein n=1 Tax=Phytohabitans maris TaxID=3071409 RepID=A0ABU0ZEC3_9ACTN|nr:RICIN domain-containing protein [Phytohabitans sp. ZYX-F-186]MDQ7905396.1 RICIN domain-containing protein [Phytohabitans sp. ZYX-F-186]
MKRKLVTLAAVALTVPAAIVAVSVLPANAASPANGGVYTLAVGASGKCLEVAGGSADNGALLQQASCSAGSTRQQWRVVSSSAGGFTLVNVNSTRCADLPSGSTSSGVQLQQWGCGDGTKVNQRWSFAASGAASGKYTIASAASGLCVSDRDGSTAGGNPIVQETCSDVARMQWLFNQVGGNPTTPPPGGVPYSNVPDGFAQGVTGGAGGQTVTVTNQSQLNQYVTASGSYVIRVSGTINISPKGTELRVASNKTIIGVGTSGQIVGGGFFLGTGVSNVIIRNLTIRDTLMPDDDPGDDAYDYDAIQLDTANRIWIDHNRLSRMNDGLIDSRKDTTNLTVSWNHLVDNNKTFGIGWTDNVTARITIHHNWLQNTRTRNPSADNIAYCHLYNNYVQNTSSYGNYIRGLTKGVIENSYFENSRNPYYVEAGELVARGNITVNSPWDSGKVTSKGSAFNPSSFYSYTLHAAADVPALLRQYAGPQASIGN